MHGLLLLVLIFCLGCQGKEEAKKPLLPEFCQQVVIVCRRPGNIHVATWYERTKEGWRNIAGIIPCVIGKNGFAPAEAKKEGDGCTPAGQYAMSFAFGSQPKCETGLNYVPMTAKHYWIDDPKSPQYNQLVEGDKPGVSHEEMLDPLYLAGAVIRYNMHPVVPGKGSAIFIHLWKPGQGKDRTAGCVAFRETDLFALLKWLDKEKHPHILLDHPELWLTEK